MNIKISLNLALRKVWLLSALLFLILTSCREDGALVPEFNSATLNIRDTFIGSVSATVPGDTLNTGVNLTKYPLGKYNDELFGTTETEIYTQFYTPSSTFPIADDFTGFDSIIMELGYKDYYGYDYEQQLEVYELTEDMGESNYSNATVTASDFLLGHAKLSVSADDSLDGDSVHVLRIPLDKSLGEKIVAHGTFNDQDEFLDLFKGIKITTRAETPPAENEGAIVYCVLRSVDQKIYTKIKLYYLDEEGAPASIDLQVPSEASSFLAIDNTYSSNLNNAIGNEELTENYISALAGPRARIRFTGIDELASLSPIGINKAQLYIPYDEQPKEIYNPPEKLTLIKKDSEGKWILVDDGATAKFGSDYFGGELELSNKQYRFNLALEIHDMIAKGDFDRELYATVSGGAVTANKLVLNSGIHPDRPIYLVVTYTKPR